MIDYKTLVQDDRINASLYTDPEVFTDEMERIFHRGRLLRMAEVGMGPASFLIPDDLIVASRNQLGLHARTAPWLLLGRGLNRETVDADGRTVSHVTDETTNRGFWRHFRTVMTEA